MWASVSECDILLLCLQFFFLTKPKLFRIHFGVWCHNAAQKKKKKHSQTVPHFVRECRLIGAEEPFIAHSAEQCPSI